MTAYHREVATNAQQAERLRLACSMEAPDSDRRIAVLDVLRSIAGRELNLFRTGDVTTVHVRALPVDDWASGSTPIADAVAMGLASLVGHPYGYAMEHETVLQDVRPRRRDDQAKTSSGATEPLGYHTDLDYFPTSPAGPFDRTNPDAIVLVAVRPDRHLQAETLFVDARDIIDDLAPRVSSQLREPKFRLPSSYSFVPLPAPQRPWSRPARLLRPRDDDVLISADLLPGAPSSNDLTASEQGAIDDRAGRALDGLRESLENSVHAVRVRLASGEALILDNRRGVHARCAFEPTFDQHDRWLKRVYARRDLSVFGESEERFLLRDATWA